MISISKIKEGPGGPSLAFLYCRGIKSNSHYVLGLQSFGALLNLELHLRAFIQGAIPVGLDGRKVNEHIVAARSLDETITFRGIEPLHCTFFLHCTFS